MPLRYSTPTLDHGEQMTVSRVKQLAKVPAVTVGFWLIKILATTLGETAGDTVSMSMNLGYLIATALFSLVLALLVWRQIAAQTFHPFLYWGTIVASTTAGTTLADLATRSLGLGYPGGSLLLLGCVVASLAVWYRRLGSIDVATVHAPKVELFYWITITFSQTLGTALGDWTADTGGLGYAGAAVVFGVLLAALAGLYFWSSLSRVALFWEAFILTRPLGAAVGDLIDKPLAQGGMALSRPIASALLVVAILILILALPQRASGHTRE